ncbi:MAG TPA: hypothetical protein VFR94_06175 [Nitrososphaeraceae archaeon]|nr:hypothetical protein [Nitrososphaeraceae archaeon]
MVEVARSKAAQQGIDWIAFKEYLSKTYNSPNSVKIRLCYAKKFYHVLLENNAQDLWAIESQEKGLNIMKSLTVLSKYLGCYDRWRKICARLICFMAPSV